MNTSTSTMAAFVKSRRGMAVRSDRGGVQAMSDVVGDAAVHISPNKPPLKSKKYQSHVQGVVAAGAHER